jgi:tryptophan synthase beta chain
MLAEYGRLPDAITACVGGGSNAMGLFHAFLNDRQVEIVGVEAAGDGISTGRTPPRSLPVAPACCTATAPMCCGRRRPDHRDPFGVGRPGLSGRRPEHAFLKDTGRARYLGITDEEALQAFHLLAHRGHPAGAGVQPRAGAGDQAGA